MSEHDDDLGRLLGDAFDAQAQASVPTGTPAPPPHFATGLTSHAAPARPHRRRVWIAPAAAAAAVVAVLSLAFGLTRGSTPGHAQAGGAPSHTGAPQRPKPTVISDPVHIKLQNADGATYGVGMPVVALFSHRVTDARAFQHATRVTVNGNTVDGAWYFETSNEVKGYPLAAHLRLRNYWPAHTSVQVSMPVRGVSAGGGWQFAEDLSLSFRTGAAMVSTVDQATHRLTVERDGHRIASYPVSLGSRSTPTTSGTKVVMAKGTSICMSGPGYDQCGIRYTQRLTDSGEYLHAAPWNVRNIDAGVDSSNGCTNMLPADAAKLYAMSEVGDVVRFPKTDGPRMSVGGGLGDWNVPWSTWLRGGAVPTH